MKNLERVAELLAELRTLAENDFERAIISRCEKDLCERPAPEIIDDDHQRFNGIVYKKNQSGHFAKDTRIHQAVWAFYYGEIPEGYQIHHIDENKNNNAIENLQCLTASEHQLLHWQKPRQIGAVREFVCDNCGNKYTAVDNGRNRYCPECRSKIQYAPPVRRSIYKKKCPYCGKEFETKYKHGIYCTRNCASKARAEQHRKEPVIYKKNCAVCGAPFETNQPKKKFCSKSCREFYYSTPHTCDFCGKNFRSRDKRARYCSHECAGKVRRKQTRRSI